MSYALKILRLNDHGDARWERRKAAPAASFDEHEAAARLGITFERLQMLRKSGRGPRHIDGCTRYTLAALQEFKLRQQIGGSE